MEVFHHCWAELIPKAPVLIFTKLRLRDKLRSVPLVCKSWRKVIAGPDCWHDIDFEEMDDLLDLDDSYYVYTVIEDLDEFRTADVIKSMHFPLLLEILVRKNSGQVHSLSCGGLLNAQTLCLVADHAQSLRTLKMPRTNLRKDSTIFETVLAVRLSSFLVHLDISKCYEIGVSAIRAIGYKCKNLARLDMNFIMTNNGTSDEEAFAIASTMPKLKHLEISHLTISNEGVLNILNSCTQLQYLDISGCSYLQGCERL